MLERNMELSREERWMLDSREELIERLLALIPEDGERNPLPGVFLYRTSATTEYAHGDSALAFCVIAQGSKELMVGHDLYRYDPAHYLLSTIDLPVASRVLTASPEQPYLSIRIDLSPVLVGEMLPAICGDADAQRAATALHVSALDMGLLDPTLRLVRLIDRPAETAVLLPLALREIIYRLLLGEQGQRLGHMALLNGSAHRIAQAVDILRQEYAQPLRIDAIAQRLGMSISGFHHHFKAVTAMSPLQFQKRLRLQEARRLMLGEDLDATSAAYRVGYEDVSHFNREYKRLFGAPPIRDVLRLREVSLGEAA
ncbi:AraC family transcriptional regulator [Chloroflexia bacterium SDU3-3]|nr:AraC family transcriptional regulator [Chloroflexia bacterium SDU3-3]